MSNLFSSLAFENELETFLRRSSPSPVLFDILYYALYPAGKRFRPQLLAHLLQDLKIDSLDFIPLALALEIHHSYSLIHDDLPCMDNDLTRRGKPSVWAHYGEWKALLAGDLSLQLSIQALEKLSHPHQAFLRQALFWVGGAKGLIQGQWLDLSASPPITLPEILRIHELKTARLMQYACLGAFQLARPQKLSIQETKQALKLGQLIGLCFQLRDDLEDAEIQKTQSHEQNLNPFLLYPHEAKKTLSHLSKKLHVMLADYPQTKKWLVSFE
jgi:geranylgeranyl diphosphate synthase type II